MTTGKTIALTRQTFVGKVMSLLFNMLSRLVITFLPKSKRLLISWLQSPSAVILYKKIFGGIDFYLWKKWKFLSCVWLCNLMGCVAVHGILWARKFSLGNPKNGLPFLSPRDLPDPGIESMSPALQVDSSPFEPPGKLHLWKDILQFKIYWNAFTWE